MAFLLGWLIGSIIVGALAENWKARDGWAWGIMAAVFSPLLLFVILLCVSNLKEQQQQLVKAQTFSFDVFKENLAGVKNLHDKGIYTEQECANRRISILNELEHKIFNGTVEQHLINFAGLVDESLISKDELQSIKSLVERKIASAAFQKSS